MNRSHETSDGTALFSSDGQTWHDGRPVDWRADPNVRRIVIGRPPNRSDDAKRVSLPQPLPGDFAERFKNLTHLHLWQVENLIDLPTLPEALDCLDLRGCKALTTLPDLPQNLQVLDLGGCEGLTELPNPVPRLRQLFVNDCLALESGELSQFLKKLTRSEGCCLQELDASRCPTVKAETLFDWNFKQPSTDAASEPRFPESFVKLVLAGCPELEKVARLARFTHLRHLDLRDCPKLRELVEIPTGTPCRLQYVRLDGPDRLTFAGQELEPTERGGDSGPDVAATLRTRHKFGGALTVSAHARLLLLGDGRVGKTTLAKRLQWRLLTKSQQAEPEYKSLRPKEREPATHAIAFGKLHTPLHIADGARRKFLQQIAGTQGFELKLSDAGDLPGVVRLWDFGGQEVYHQTHRAFAGAGAVCLILWRKKRLSDEELQAGRPQGIEPEEWREMNRPRPLDYWLDYVQTLGIERARIAVVCTGVKKDDPKPPVPVADASRLQGIETYSIDSLDEADCEANPEFAKLLDFIRRQGGAVADRLGMVQPLFYEQASGLVDALRKELNWQRAHRNLKPKEPVSPVVGRDTWFEKLQQKYQPPPGSNVVLTTEDLDVVTAYLHSAGQIFDLHPGAGRDPKQNPSSKSALADSVVIDPSWAIEIVYQLLKPADDGGEGVFELVRQDQGKVKRELLLRHKALDETPELAEPLLQFMQQCDILAPLRGWQEDPDSRTPTEYLVTEKWLLPKFEGELRQRCEAAADGKRRQPDVQGLQVTFSQDRLCEFDFRPILAHVARHFGSLGAYYHDGFQVMLGTNAEEAVLLRGRWINGVVGRLVLGALGSLEVLERWAETWAEVLGGARLLGSAECVVVEADAWCRPLEVEPPAQPRTGALVPACPRVLISYSHDSHEMTDRVFKLAKKLRRDGIDAWIDQFDPHPVITWPEWMLREIKRAQIVLMLFTPGYVQKMETEQRSGVRFETFYIIQRLYQQGMVNDKFIPIVWTREDERHIVDEFHGCNWYAVETDDGYERLLRLLLNDPEALIPPLGTPRLRGPLRS
ncbi:MAG: TIR domain-containing protein [Planctomycetota bacterium]|nr:TIR domain-containing protein [Planctomycetota bacterium]